MVLKLALASITGLLLFSSCGSMSSLAPHNPNTAALHHGVCAAAASHAHPTPSGGLAPAGDCLALADRFPPTSR